MLLCDADKPITMELVNDYITKHEERMPRYNYLENLYEGFHDIFNLPEKEGWKPDNRLAANFPKYITDVFLGYAYGIPIKRSHKVKEVDDAFKEFDRLNKMDEHDYELAKKVCKYGHAFEYFYQDEESITRVSDHTPKEIFIVYENTLRKAAYFSVRYGVKDNGFSKYGEVITREEIITFDGDEF
jgi:SPP1 family phage portal protein